MIRSSAQERGLTSGFIHRAKQGISNGYPENKRYDYSENIPILIGHGKQ
jgi:hypothetical protein